ncbi:phosphatidylinositol 3-kinase 2 [Heterostelium album PN500]|uniref:Phosphatidylinositol 3-kinase 2 n=1 Tax=Heterostelium pallidum (strain ATCC 26659 / Pp 5 / PN500) TaxID=670386 RepID=D3B534_HETP5|nr:phosphatidylinositol 3-kinase 2 [Heterostelium album PN500]EFA83399.1 phosphatidylinositol 3-kinase 2 [Heterostelium album PN500]|eukprot:XP_020435516.1 phosphatidylinositol 3-kinase 2 [Heterostelium album PN500]
MEYKKYINLIFILISIYVVNSVSLTNIYQSYGYIQIFGDLDSTTRVEIGDTITNHTQPCINIFKFNSSHISCEFYNSTYIDYTTLNITVYFNATTPGTRVSSEIAIPSQFGYQFDGCKPTYFFDTINKICKKASPSNLYSYICKQGAMKITRISTNGNLGSTICSDLKFGGHLDSMNIVDMIHYRYIQYQRCWNIGNLTSYMVLEADLPNFNFTNPASFIKQMTKQLCSSVFSTPDIIDLAKSNDLYRYTCINSLNIPEDRIVNSVPGPRICDGRPADSMERIITNWLTDIQCLNGDWNSDGQCVCRENWSGPSCTNFICKNGFSLNTLSNSCFCNKTCKEDEMLEPVLCQCMCSPNNPIRCSDGSCVDAVSACDSKLTCPPESPFKCFNGSCSDSPWKCRALSPRCRHPDDCCWDGSPVKDVLSCLPLPACLPPFNHRCQDGTCKAGADSCIDFKNPFCELSVCPDGVNCPPCPQYDGCPISVPFQCTSGACGANNTDCNPLNMLRSDILNGVAHLPIFDKPESTQVTIQLGKPTNISVVSENDILIGQIDILIPPVEATNFTVVSVTPLSDSYLRQVTFNNSKYSFDNSIFSPVLNITFSHLIRDENYHKDRWFDFYVSIKFNVNMSILSENIIGNRLWESVEMPYDDILLNYCLGYINETLNQWTCVHSNNSKKDLLHFDKDSEMVVGWTNHFTSFALLLRTDPVPNSQKPEKSFNDKLIMIITVVSIVSFVFIGCLVALVYYSFKKYGSFSTMRRAWKEKLRARLHK